MGDEQQREADGWRSGRPVEDPDKVKRWGRITAKPSEYLVHCRRGRVLDGSSGQGASCFKWPSDSVAIVPTSLQRLSFVADQVTRERVGVRVEGFAVYRVAEPLIAYRVLNFSYAERAQEKLAETLTAMLVGATRRLVASLEVDQVLERRKDALSTELLREIAPVLSGEGRPDDATDRGWGVVVDTLEIKDVRVTSERVFAAMQAPYRAAIERRARLARAEADEAAALAEAEATKNVEARRLAGEAELARTRAAIERARTEERARDAARAAALAAEQAEAEVAAKEARLAALRAEAELGRARVDAELEQQAARSAVEHATGLRVAEVEAARAAVAVTRAEAEARVVTAQKLPELAAAVGQRFGETRVVQIGGSPDALHGVAQAVRSVLEVARG